MGSPVQSKAEAIKLEDTCPSSNAINAWKLERKLSAENFSVVFMLIKLVLAKLCGFKGCLSSLDPGV